MLALALRLGKTIGEIGALSSRELAEWMAYFRLAAKADGAAPKDKESQLRDLLDADALAGLKSRRR
jgi:hypothetical protein